MAITSPVTVATAPTLLCCCDYARRLLTLQNTGEVDVFISHCPTVSITSYQYKILAGEVLQLPDKCKFYAVVETGTGTVAVLQTKI